MLESDLNRDLKPLFDRVGVFQKLSDASTPGVPDWIGCFSGSALMVFIECKILKGVESVKAKFEPGQLPFARRWPTPVLMISYHHHTDKFFVHNLKLHGHSLEAGVNTNLLYQLAIHHSPNLPELLKDLEESYKRIYIAIV